MQNHYVMIDPCISENEGVCAPKFWRIEDFQIRENGKQRESSSIGITNVNKLISNLGKLLILFHHREYFLINQDRAAYLGNIMNFQWFSIELLANGIRTDRHTENKTSMKMIFLYLSGIFKYKLKIFTWNQNPISSCRNTTQ